MIINLDSDIKRVLNSVVKNHLSKIGSGNHRSVYRINTTKFGKKNKGRVVKFPVEAPDLIEDLKNQRGAKMNKREFQTWMAVKGTKAEKYFCPIRGRSKNFEFIIMDYAKPIKKKIIFSESKSEIKDDVEGIVKFIRQDSKFMPYDIIDQNVGKHPNRDLVLIDYPYGGNIEIK